MRYVLPQRIGKTGQPVSLFLRVSQPVGKVKFTVQSGDTVLATAKRLKAAPGEMEKLNLQADKLSSVKRIFQAVRIEVNGALDVISTANESAVRRLKKGGRISVISFHSLEDRIVKQSFAKLAKGCDCPRDIPVCVCGKTPVIKLVTRKPVLPREKEPCIQEAR